MSALMATPYGNYEVFKFLFLDEYTRKYTDEYPNG